MVSFCSKKILKLIQIQMANGQMAVSACVRARFDCRSRASVLQRLDAHFDTQQQHLNSNTINARSKSNIATIL